MRIDVGIRIDEHKFSASLQAVPRVGEMIDVRGMQAVVHEVCHIVVLTDDGRQTNDRILVFARKLG